MSLRVCIPTAGTGSRLGGLTKFLNKSLVSVADRPTLCHLIEQFPDDTEFVIALGHKGHLVREFVALAYPTRVFHFSEVDPFEGPGSGLGLSLLACQQHLQQPFIFLSCDTLVSESIPAPSQNWAGYADANDVKAYRTLAVCDGRVSAIHEKMLAPPGTRHAYIGLAGIHDHRTFWESMNSGGVAAIDTGEAFGLRALLPIGVNAHAFTWHDTGNPSSLASVREIYREPDAPTILEKANEAIWFIGNDVIKFSDDTDFISNRVRRVEALRGFIPEVTGAEPHMYRYDKADGKVLSEVVTIPLFEQFLKHCKTFWILTPLSEVAKTKFKSGCDRFYRTKTRERVDLFYRNFDLADGSEAINDEAMPTLAALLDRVDWAWLADGKAGRFHGDFHFENILWDKNQARFVFLDWRQDFAGDIATGDIYYDLAKLLHGLIVSHELIAANLYEVDWQADAIRFDLHRKQVLVQCERHFCQWLLNEGFDLKKVGVLTALIYLNIAALHHHPYSLLLYALGKSMLKGELEK